MKKNYGVLGIFSTGCIQSDLNQLEAETHVEDCEEEDFRRCPSCGEFDCVCDEFFEEIDVEEQICKCGDERNCICWALEDEEIFPPDHEKN